MDHSGYSLLRTVRTHGFAVLQETESYRRLRGDSELGLHCSILMKNFPEESPDCYQGERLPRVGTEIRAQCQLIVLRVTVMCISVTSWPLGAHVLSDWS